MMWSLKPFNSAEMREYLNILEESEAAAPAATPAAPELPAQDGDQGDGSKVTTNPDGTKTYAGAFGTFTYDKAGKAVKYSSPSFSGASRTVDLTNQQTTQNYNQGPLNVSRTTDASGKQVGSNAEYTMGNTTLAQKTDAAGNATNTTTAVQEEIEDSVTSTTYPKHGLNKQQKSVNQMPALFKMPKQGPVLGGDPNKKAPSQGYFVGGESEDCKKDAIEEGYASEDVVSTVKKGLYDFLRSIEDQRELDHELANKAKDNIKRDELDRILPVKTIRTHDGRDIKIHGNEIDGFHVRINERPVTARFADLDDAVMACEMYCNRRQMAEQEVQSQDYMDEE